MGSVLCNTTATMKNGSSIAYDPTVGSKVLGVAPPVTTAKVNGAPLPTAAWYKTSPVTISLTSVANDWATRHRDHLHDQQWNPGHDHRLDRLVHRPCGPIPRTARRCLHGGVLGPDNIGSQEAAKTVVIRIDTTKPITTATPSTTDWTNADVTVTLAASDPGASANPATGSGVKATYYTVDSGTQKTYSGAFTVSSLRASTP